MNATNRFLFLLPAVVLACASNAFATDAEWHWEQFGTANYGGQIQLKDDQGNAANYQRYSDGSSPVLFGATSVQSPLMVIAAGIDVDILNAGNPVTKPICTGSREAKIYVTAVTACDVYRANPANPLPSDPGLGSNIGGIQTWAEDTSATTWTPRLAVYVPGIGWRRIDNHPCGRVQVQTMCK